jgi:hypothetical protein
LKPHLLPFYIEDPWFPATIFSSFSYTGDRKTGTFIKQIQIESMQQQKILLTVIEPPQLAN